MIGHSMRTTHRRTLGLLAATLAASSIAACNAPKSADQPATVSKVAPESRDAAALRQRMQWWTDARLGMFIHFGLYAVPAGKWGNKDGYGEWIRSEAQIPVAEYDKFLKEFNPANFDADKIVLAAKNAGMKYITITSKHHDGFCLFATKQNEFNVMYTPFKRDIMKEMADACHKHGVKICWYYSIMDWHHPDYTPRRDWEKDRPTDNANFDRYVAYMKAQLKELLTNYGEIGVLWFDGQWEGTWNDDRGRDLETYVRSLQPSIVINSRVGRGGGAYGLDGRQLGDYSTPEQFIPETNPGGYWETCMTMNEHWGYNAVDKDFKSTRILIRNTVDIASKGGNFLLNIGPTGLGEIPPESVERLKDMAKWMSRYGDAIHGTSASPFKTNFSWGRCTVKPATRAEGQIVTTTLYLHVFDWPTDGKLVVPGLLNKDQGAWIYGDKASVVPVTRDGDSLVLTLPPSAPDADSSVVVLNILGTPDVSVPPTITADANQFVDTVVATVASEQKNVQVHYTINGAEPTTASPIATGPVTVASSLTIKARSFRDGRIVSPIVQSSFEKVAPRPALQGVSTAPGLNIAVFDLPADIKTVAEMAAMKPVKEITAAGFDLSARPKETKFAMRFTGYVNVPATGMYRFYTNSDDGSTLRIGDTLVVDNDKPHSVEEKSGVIGLEKGFHPITVDFFENSGGFELKVGWQGPGFAKEVIPAAALVRKSGN